jgi:prevent-host-death family protein
MPISQKEDTKTVEELASQTREILDQVRQTGQPVAITVDGQPAAMLVEARRFERLLHVAELSRLVREAEEDIRAGRVQPLEEFLDELDREQKASSHNHRKRPT